MNYFDEYCKDIKDIDDCKFLFNIITLLSHNDYIKYCHMITFIFSDDNYVRTIYTKTKEEIVSTAEKYISTIKALINAITLFPRDDYLSYCYEIICLFHDENYLIMHYAWDISKAASVAEHYISIVMGIVKMMTILIATTLIAHEDAFEYCEMFTILFYNENRTEMHYSNIIYHMLVS